MSQSTWAYTNQSRVTIKSQITTTVLNTTTDHSTVVDCTGFTRAHVLTSVIANASASPELYWDISVDGTNYTQYATLHPDLTTTANVRYYTSLEALTKSSRIRLHHQTTTTHLRYVVKAELLP